MGCLIEKAKEQVIALFNKVKLPRAEAIYDQYPHQISGGQKQRVMIAMAIACKPKVLIADEPTTALDVTVQKEIIHLLKELQQETQMSILFISHDLGLVSEIANNVVVMFKGNIVEQGTAEQVFKNPKEEYTKALINSKPSLKHRLKILPTVEDYMQGKVELNIETKEERDLRHQDIYKKEPFLEVNNLKKYFGGEKTFFGKKNKLSKSS